MGFKLRFERIGERSGPSMGTYHHWVLIIKCTNLLFGETIDYALFPSNGSYPWIFKNEHFKAGESRIVGTRKDNWHWHQGDYVEIRDAQGKVLQRLDFIRTEYALGECPECHGTGKCGKCHGNCLHIDSKLNRHWCDRCNSGKCPTCDIEYRSLNFGSGPSGLRQF